MDVRYERGPDGDIVLRAVGTGEALRTATEVAVAYLDDETVRHLLRHGPADEVEAWKARAEREMMALNSAEREGLGRRWDDDPWVWVVTFRKMEG